MSACPDYELLLHGLLDGELDAANALRCERHISGCGHCASAYAALSAFRSRVRGAGLRLPAPPGLHKRIRASIARFGSPPVYLARRAALPLAMAAAAGLALVVLLPQRADLGEEVAAGHVRSMMAMHLTDVASSDHHTVKPWFAGRLDFSPPVYDLANEGFPLAGGRVDYLNGRPVAAIVYRHGAHVINLFVWPAQRSDELPIGAMVRDGYNVRHWTRQGMTCWAVSDLNGDELAQFERLIKGATPA